MRALIALCLVACVSVAQAAVYGGCFEDFPDRILPQRMADGLSRKECRQACKQAGYQYAGVEYGEECWCGNEAPKKKAIDPNVNCTFPCDANPSKTCGGAWAIEVFYIRAGYMGCYVDYQPNIFPGRLLPKVVKQDFAMNRMRCLELCSDNPQVSNYVLAGVENGRQCFCATEFNPDAPVDLRDDSECDHECFGNRFETCGGSYRINVFRVRD